MTSGVSDGSVVWLQGYGARAAYASTQDSPRTNLEDPKVEIRYVMCLPSNADKGCRSCGGLFG